VSTPVPPPTEKIVAPHGGPNQTWWQYFSDLGTRAASSEGSIGGLGTAAAEDIGTSGATVPLCNTVNAWSKQQYFPIATLTDAANIAWNLDTQQTAIVTLGGSRTLANATNAKPGATYQLAVIAGAHVLSFDTMYLFPANGAVPTTVGKSLFSFFCPSADELWCVGVKEFA
jgi:hypothetical protein